MPIPSQDVILRALGVDAVDAQGNTYRLIYAPTDAGLVSGSYGIASAVLVPDGAMLTIPGLAGEWRVSGGYTQRGGWHYASIS